ncbi:MAG: ABC transporter permease [Bacilli bacterium]|nr:ABC transporter permease [Bacilli bacterium]
MKKTDKDFEFTNLPEECNDSSIKKEDFKFVKVDPSFHETKFETKPTTFLKDSVKRFRKNKSSVVAAYVLGALVLLAIVVPLASPYDVSKPGDTSLYNLQPKLFNGGGFWDGTTTMKNIAVDASDPDQTKWRPDPTRFLEDGISNLTISNAQYTDQANEYSREGYVNVGYFGSSNFTSLNSRVCTATLKPAQYSIYLNEFDTVNEEKIKLYNEYYDEPYLTDDILPKNSELGEVTLQFNYEDEEGKHFVIDLLTPKKVHNIGSPLLLPDTEPIDISPIILAKSGFTTEFNRYWFSIKVSKDPLSTSSDKDILSLIKKLTIMPDVSLASSKVLEYFTGYLNNVGVYIPGINFDNAGSFVARSSLIKDGVNSFTNTGYWSFNEYDINSSFKKVHLAVCHFASFTYDTYKATLGKRNMVIEDSEINEWCDKGWLYLSFDYDDITLEIYPDTFVCVILNSDRCPLVEPFDYTDIYLYHYDDETFFSVKTDILYYKKLGYVTMPKFLFGTDKTGRDMFKYVFEGLRNSLLLGILTFVVCFLFGLLWGAISGYFGGTVDLVMERFTDILSGVPWIVVMTIVILKTEKSNFWTFALALCLTGWIGTASLTRTQFYRFRGREYVLASRTLGASDARLIAKHILPNAMGTIITSSVLMIPTVIFEEATISYLGLGFKNLSSLGVILSNNQNELTTHPYQLIFPAVVIALVMIAFNLFGNGLRDAINPSLKGEEE